MEHVKIENINKHKFLVYTLTSEESLDPVILRMMENNAIRGLLAVSFLQKDAYQVLKYDISGMTVLANFIKCCTNGMKLLMLLKDLSDILLEAKEYMIEEEYFLFGMHSVFVGNDGKGRLLCLPVDNRNGVLFRQFCIGLLNQPDVSIRLHSVVLAQVNTYLNSGKFSLGEFSALLDNIELQSAVSVSPDRQAGAQGSVLQRSGGPVVLGGKDRSRNADRQAGAQEAVVQKLGGPVVLGGKDRVQKKTRLADQIQKVRQSSAEMISGRMPQKKKVRGYLYRKSSNEKIEVDKSRFCIGKSRENMDYCISDNPTVSRIHAAVMRQGDLFYLQDMGSLNHTYVNGRMLQEGQNAVLENGTEVCFSNEEFLFLTEKD